MTGQGCRIALPSGSHEQDRALANDMAFGAWAN
jgi:hypothetical protein